MPKNVGSIKTWSAKMINVDILNSAHGILQCWSYYVKKLCKTSTWHRKNSKQNGIVAIDSCLALFGARQYGATTEKALMKNIHAWESSGSGLKIWVRGYFSSELSLLLRHSDEPQRGRNSYLWLQFCSVLSSFGVMLMSCRVIFHVVRSALQYSAYRI